MYWKGSRGRCVVLLLITGLQTLRAQDQACIDALFAADDNGDDRIDRTEYISLMGDLSPYQGCPDEEDSTFNGLGPFSLAFESLSCLCLRYNASDPDCCSGTNKAFAVPGVFADSYTTRVCQVLNETLASECEIFPLKPQPTAAPTLSPPTFAPTVVIPPTATPTSAPNDPTSTPTTTPTGAPNDPTLTPTATPTSAPTDATLTPTAAPTSAPSELTLTPTATPTNTVATPTSTPSATPSTVLQTNEPTVPPTSVPSATPSRLPTSQIRGTSNAPTASPVAFIVEVPTEEGSPTNGSPTEEGSPFQRGVPDGNDDDDKSPARIVVPVVFGAIVVLLGASLFVYRRHNAEKQNRFSTLAKGALQEDLQNMDPTNESDDTDVPAVGSPQRMGYLLNSLLVDEEQASVAATNQSEYKTLGSKSLKSSESRSSLEIFEHDDTGSDSSSGVLVIARSKSPRSPVTILNEGQENPGVTAREDDSSQWMEFHAPDSDSESKETDSSDKPPGWSVVKNLDNIFTT